MTAAGENSVLGQAARARYAEYVERGDPAKDFSAIITDIRGHVGERQ